MAYILIVDDDSDLLKIAEQVLSHAGHTVQSCLDARVAMDLLESAPFDLLISDANMPQYSGFELVQTVRHHSRLKDMAIMMLTGLRERKDIEKAAKLGVDDYLVKPLDPLILIQKVNTLLEKRPPIAHPEVLFRTDSPLGQGFISVPLQLERVSELGLIMISRSAVAVGQIVDIKSKFFDDIGIKAPPIRVVQVELKKDSLDEWRIHGSFLGAPEAVLQRIRKWIFTHGASQKAA